MLKRYDKPMTFHRRLLRACTFAVSAVALVTPQALAGGTAHAVSARTANASTPGPYAVAAVSYNLGDRAYHLTETGQPAELAATVHYPKNLGSKPHPLVVQLHGWHETCADRAAEATRDAAERAEDWDAYSAANRRLWNWPCAPATKPIANERGYDYLGERLASQGFIVLSIRANGINASSVSGDENASSRADLINKHLTLWKELNSTGKGQLSGKFLDEITGKPRQVDFTHHVDMHRVGTMGHSRGGAGVTWQAADRHRSKWPAGVEVKAVLALAPAYNEMSENMTAYEIKRTPLGVIRGTCDGQVGDSSFALDATGKSKMDFYKFQIHGANHNYFNTQWSPNSGQVAAWDDAVHLNGQTGRCTDIEKSGSDTQLNEAQQRQVGATYIEAFFRRYLADDTRFGPVLTGQKKPVAHITAVDVTAVVR
ncbi:alpha/beta hydrolase [Streptomyces sp. NPDC001635]